MATTIPQARQLTALTSKTLTSTREAQLSQNIISLPAAAKTDNGQTALRLLVDQQKQAERIDRQKQTLTANNRLNSLVVKEGNAQDLQTIIAIDRQKDALNENNDDEAAEIMQAVAADQTPLSGYPHPQETQERDTDASRMAQDLREKAADNLQNTKADTANTDDNQTKGKIQQIAQWCKQHVILLSIAALALVAVVGSKIFR